MIRARKPIVWISAILISSLFCVSIFLVFSIFLFSSQSNQYRSNSPSFDYQMSEINVFTKESSRGFASLPRKLKQDEYITYLDEETGSTFIISNFFDGTEFKCRGNCYCEDSSPNRRSSAPITLSRGLTVLLSALSTSMAINVAKDAFRDQCAHEFSDTCTSPSSVLSEVDDCEEELAEIIDLSTFQNQQSGEQGVITFECKGHCLQLSEKIFTPEYVNGVEFVSQGREHIGSCKELTMDGTVEIVDKSVDDRGQVWVPKSVDLEAKKAFMVDRLHPFCIRHSMLQTDDFSESGRVKLEKFLWKDPDDREKELEAISWLSADGMARMRQIPFCFGLGNFVAGEKNSISASSEEDNVNVHCVRSG